MQFPYALLLEKPIRDCKKKIIGVKQQSNKHQKLQLLNLLKN